MQSMFKLLLTQGDALVMSFLSSLADQGAFALASNYGGLLARLVFQPVEESSRNLFGRLLAPSATSEASAEKAPSKSELITKRTSRSSTEPSKTANNRLALNHLSSALHIYLLLSRPLVALVPPLLPTLLPFALSSQWRTPGTVTLLQSYCYYIPLLAVNGILDAFVTSVATPSQLRTQSLWMLGFTALYGCSAVILVKSWGLGSVGLVGANVVNTVARIEWGLWFVRKWVERRKTEEREGAKLLWKGIRSEVLPNAVCVLVGLALMRDGVGTSSSAIDVKTGEVNLGFLGLWTAAAVGLGTAL
jgi:oligosaccharide translocation protein RFT1